MRVNRYFYLKKMSQRIGDRMAPIILTWVAKED